MRAVRSHVKALLVDVRLPVRGHPPGRPRNGLAHRVILWRDQVGSRLVELTVLVVVEPHFAWLKAADYRMPGRRGMSARMLGWRRVATADVPALCASAQVDPPAPAHLALYADCPARHGRQFD